MFVDFIAALFHVIFFGLAAVVHLGPAVGAEHKAGQGIGFPEGIDAPGRTPQLLNRVEHRLLYDALMGVVEYLPFLFGIPLEPFVFIRFFSGAEIHRMPAVFGLRQNILYCAAIPCVWLG